MLLTKTSCLLIGDTSNSNEQDNYRETVTPYNGLKITRKSGKKWTQTEAVFGNVRCYDYLVADWRFANWIQ